MSVDIGSDPDLWLMQGRNRRAAEGGMNTGDPRESLLLDRLRHEF
jgi:hypothetical protein